LSISKLLETSSTPSNNNQALENALEVLNKNAISAVLVESEQRKRLAGCCCLTKFLSLPSKKYQATSGIITVPKTQLVKIIEKEKQRGTDINEIIARMINCRDFNNY